MNKKIKWLMVLCFMGIFALGAFANPNENCKEEKSFCKPNFNKTKEDYINKKHALEIDLNLNSEQKTKLQKIRMEKERELEPLRKQLDAKREEIRVIKLSRIAEKMQQEKISAVETDITTINKKILSVKQAKQKEFEKILTKEQLAQYKKIKKSDEDKSNIKKRETKKEIKKNVVLK